MKKVPGVVVLLVCALAGLFPEATAKSAFILTYHTFLGTHTSTMDYSEEEMGAQLDRMRALGYTFVTLADAIAGRMEGTKNIVITIDDGNHSVYPAWERVFRPRSIKPDIFIPARSMNYDQFYLSWKQISEMAAAGCGIVTHGWTHEHLSDYAFDKDEAKCLKEIMKPAGLIEARTGIRPTLFGYPYGVGCKRAEDEVIKAGYEWAFTADGNFIPVNFDDPALDHFQVPRTIVYRWKVEKLLAHLENPAGTPSADSSTTPSVAKIATSGTASDVSQSTVSQ
jgi:peptidoglycan/xylan/chitin deacetylase (PgdA/CDA1 family)